MNNIYQHYVIKNKNDDFLELTKKYENSPIQSELLANGYTDLHINHVLGEVKLIRDGVIIKVIDYREWISLICSFRVLSGTIPDGSRISFISRKTESGIDFLKLINGKF